MRLDISSLEVQSFPTTAIAEKSITAPDTGQGGPQSYCWICEPSDETVPSCDYRCQGTDTFIDPACTYA
jgi:hypothetical protein